MNAAVQAIAQALAEHRESMGSWAQEAGYTCSCQGWTLPFGNGPVESARLHRLHRAERVLEALIAALNAEEVDMQNSL